MRCDGQGVDQLTANSPPGIKVLDQPGEHSAFTSTGQSSNPTANARATKASCKAVSADGTADVTETTGHYRRRIRFDDPHP
eukprot:SAG31_NODE_4629_length_3085_cov_2.778299_5_plen_81_part_00